MKVLFNWLKEFVPLSISWRRKRRRRCRASASRSLPCSPSGKNLTGVVAAEVKDVRKHPNADRLSVCTVSDGKTQFEVVCGASNVRAGIRVPLAKVGAVLPDGHAITAAKLRGVDSQGMICSAQELGWKKPPTEFLFWTRKRRSARTSSRCWTWTNSSKSKLTPNRRDALSVLGVARELAAGLNISLKQPEPRIRELELADSVAISNQAPLSLSAIHRPLRPRCACWPNARMDGPAPGSVLRHSLDQQPGGYHQLRDAGAGSAAARV